MNFNFLGAVPASKSLFNRALIIQSHAPSVHLHGDTHADDVLLMRSALAKFNESKPSVPIEMNCGAAGTVLRFLSFRVSRTPGIYRLIGTQRLLSRLPEEHKRVLLQLGCEVEWQKDVVVIRSWGWKPSGDAIHVPAEDSSQLVSGVLLNCWKLEQPLLLILPKRMSSVGYLTMTEEITKRFGLRLEQRGQEIFVPANQSVIPSSYTIEPDMSCAFAVAAFAILFGRADLLSIPRGSAGQIDSLQPDARFFEIIRSMGATVDANPDNRITIIKPEASLKPVEVDLNSAPDLFPVLAILCSQCDGESVLKNISHLKHKESDRIKKTTELLARMNIKFELAQDQLRISGSPSSRSQPHQNFFYFDPDHDHRMAMAAALAKRIGYRLEIVNPDCVQKSFPEFWAIAGVTAQ